MRIALFINTPAQWHFWRNIVEKLMEDGHKCKLLFRKYRETLDVVEGLVPIIYSYQANSKYGKILSLPFDILRATKKLYGFKPDLVVGFGLYDTFSSLLLRSSNLVFTDGEFRSSKYLELQYKMFLPFSDVVITPESFLDDLGEKHLRVASYKELAYLHPNYYTPRDDVLDMMGVSEGEDYVLLRFNAFDAVHDIGIGGFSYEDKLRLVKELEKHARVFISSETELPKELEDYALPVPKTRIHDVIYHAKLLVTDTQTMATEAAILGTPVIRCNKFVGPNDMGNFIELEKRYGLMYNYQISEKELAIKKAVELVQEENLKKEWYKKREKLLKEKIDITAFMVWFIENYPESLEEFRQNPDIQYRFR